jgi:hypothetical protein
MCFEKYACVSGMQCIALYELAVVKNFLLLIKCVTSFPIFYVHSVHGRYFFFLRSAANNRPAAVGPVTLRVVIFNTLLVKYPE